MPCFFVSSVFLSFFVSAFTGLLPFLVFLFIRSFIYFKKHGFIIGWVVVFHWSLLRKQRPGNAIILQNHSSKGNAIDLFFWMCSFRMWTGTRSILTEVFLGFPHPFQEYPGIAKLRLYCSLPKYFFIC
jgi:hypothetical protein